jgi:hypothetical protein
MRIRAAECLAVRVRRRASDFYLHREKKISSSARHDDSGATSILTLRSVYCVNNSGPSEFRGELGRGRGYAITLAEPTGSSMIVVGHNAKTVREDVMQVARTHVCDVAMGSSGGQSPRGDRIRARERGEGRGNERRGGIGTSTSWFRLEFVVVHAR